MKKMNRGMPLPVFLVAAVYFVCQCAGAQVIHNFSSDGCSLFPDGTIKQPGFWCECCFEHDIAYWGGGTKEDRLHADERLRECVLKKTGDRTLSETMFQGVRFGGQPVFPNWYRWGYGWNYGRGYEPLTDEEKAAVSERLKAYRASNPRGYCKNSSQSLKAGKNSEAQNSVICRWP